MATEVFGRKSTGELEGFEICVTLDTARNSASLSVSRSEAGLTN